MSRTIKKVEYLEDYKLKLYFDNKSVKIVNLENMLKDATNLFVPLAKISYFKKVKCDGITIGWPNGVELCPDVLYEIGKSVPQSTKKHKKLVRVPKSRKKLKL